MPTLTRHSKILAALSFTLSGYAACGGDVEFGGADQGSHFAPTADQGTSSARDMGRPVRDSGALPPRDMSTPDPLLDMTRPTPRDMSTPPVDMGTPPAEDMRTEPVDMGAPAVDMNPPVVDMGGPPAGPPPSPSVETVLNQGCTTTVVKGLSEQLIEEMNCMDPGVVSSFAYLSNLNLYAAVFPFLQTPAVQALDNTVSGQNTLTISSALRSVPQQYLLYRWYQQGRCNISLAARPGRSNHNGAKALDTPDYTAWKSRFSANNWAWLGSNDPVHFTFGGGKEIRALSVEAFQRLWNRNNPNDTIAEDGDYGPMTEARLKQSPSNGFAIPPWCPSSRQYQEHERLISPAVRLVDVQPGLVTLETYVSSVVDSVIYRTPETEVTVARSPLASAQFQATLSVGDEAALVPFEMTTFDASGQQLRTARGVLPGSRALTIMPEGGGIYIVSLDDPPPHAHRMVVYVDGEEVALDPTSMQSESPFELWLSLRPWRDELMARQVRVELEDAWGNRLDVIELDLMITY